MVDMKKMIKHGLQMACNAVTDAHLDAIGEDRMMTFAEWEEIMADTLINNGVVPVVLCKDCKHYDACELVCELMFNPCDTNVAWYPQDFCSYGEKREV